MAGKRLICEQDVLAMESGGVLRLDSGSIITPSALDCAHARGIRVQREKGAAPREGAGKKECLWHSMLENDGTYVVQIVQGQATVTKLTDRGPLPYGTDSAQEHHR